MANKGLTNDSRQSFKYGCCYKNARNRCVAHTFNPAAEKVLNNCSLKMEDYCHKYNIWLNFCKATKLTFDLVVVTFILLDIFAKNFDIISKLTINYYTHPNTDTPVNIPGFCDVN